MNRGDEAGKSSTRDVSVHTAGDKLFRRNNVQNLSSHHQMQPTSRDSYFKAILSIIGVALEFVPKDDIPALQKDPEKQNICFENTIFIGAPFF